MLWNDHYRIEGRHAFLSPSNFHWLRYDPDKLRQRYINELRKQEGTELHEFASVAIKKKVKLANHKKALNQFVNDAIGFDMESEKVLYYSDHCFGTVDAILYDEVNKLLRVHDLKTGTSKASFDQLVIYCALFCLEYDIMPEDISFSCRIYQYSGYEEIEVEGLEVGSIMNHIVTCDAVLDGLINTI